MNTRFTIVLVSVLFLGADAIGIAQSNGKNLSAEPVDLALFGKHNLQPNAKPVTIVVEGATITLAPGTKLNLSAVKSKSGYKVRLEIPGATIDATRLRVDSGEIEAGKDGGIHIRSSQSAVDEEPMKALPRPK